MIARSTYQNIISRTVVALTTGSAVDLTSSSTAIRDAVQIHNCSTTSDVWITTYTELAAPSVNDKDFIVGPGQTLIYDAGTKVILSGVMATADASVVVTELGY